MGLGALFGKAKEKARAFQESQERAAAGRAVREAAMNEAKIKAYEQQAKVLAAQRKMQQQKVRLYKLEKQMGPRPASNPLGINFGALNTGYGPAPAVARKKQKAASGRTPQQREMDPFNLGLY